jgi:hypothetical protein
VRVALSAYDPPGFMTDFDRIPGQRAQWSLAVSGWFDECIEGQLAKLQGQSCQFYNQLRSPPTGTALAQDIVWNGFSGTLRNRYGRAQALKLADTPVPLTQRIDGPGSYFVGGQWENLFYRPLDEYCEWHVTRDPDGKIRRVTFTSEPPEYWQALHGDTLPSIEGTPTYPTVGDRSLLLDLYREYVSRKVEYEDLICAEDLVDYSEPGSPTVVYAKGTYNPYNRWNTTDGIMHLIQPANTLGAEIKLAADATVLRSAQGSSGRVLADPDALIACAAYGGLNRASDPTIGASVNELAALGFAITLRNPVGLYMDHLDMAGWEGPDGSPIDPTWFRVLRGRPGMIEHAVFEVPPREGFTVSDITIGGVPIAYGGHLGEHMTVKLVGLASEPGRFSNRPIGCAKGACADAANPAFLYYRNLGEPCAAGRVPAFDYPEPTDQTLAQDTQTAAEKPGGHNEGGNAQGIAVPERRTATAERQARLREASRRKPGFKILPRADPPHRLR